MYYTCRAGSSKNWPITVPATKGLLHGINHEAGYKVVIKTKKHKKEKIQQEIKEKK